MLNGSGTFVAVVHQLRPSRREIYRPYSNVQPLRTISGRSLSRTFFRIDRYFPGLAQLESRPAQPQLIKAVNMHVNVNIPLISPVLAVEYFFICSSRAAAPGPGASPS